jgi:vacuolar protein sorting-associated protein 29
LKVGVIHGHTLVPSVDPEALLIAAREMGVDVFVWGGTHRFEALELEGRFFINPGSATGAIAPGYWAEGYVVRGVVRLMVREEPVPSFMLMDLQGMSLVLYIYTLENGQIKVEKVSPVMLRWLIVVVISKRRIIIAEVTITVLRSR